MRSFLVLGHRWFWRLHALSLGMLIGYLIMSDDMRSPGSLVLVEAPALWASVSFLYFYFTSPRYLEQVRRITTAIPRQDSGVTRKVPAEHVFLTGVYPSRWAAAPVVARIECPDLDHEFLLARLYWMTRYGTVESFVHMLPLERTENDSGTHLDAKMELSSKLLPEMLQQQRLGQTTVHPDEMARLVTEVEAAYSPSPSD